MSITTDLAQFVTKPGTCGSCAAGLVFLPSGDGRFKTARCPCTHADPIEHVAEVDAPIPDPIATDNEETL